MMPERAEAMLKSYKTCLGRVGNIDAYLELLENDLAHMEANFRDDLLHGGSSQSDGMPHGTSVGNPTERIGIMLASGIMTDDIEQVRKKIAALKRERAEKVITLNFVEAWLKGLSAKERWMIERCYFDEMTYREINVKYREVYGESCSKDLLRRTKKTALAKIFEMAK